MLVTTILIILIIILIIVLALVPTWHGKAISEMPEFEVGDIVLMDGNHVGAALTRILTFGKYTHCGIINRIGEDGKPYVLHCSPEFAHRNIGDVREDYLFGPYFKTWSNAIYLMKQLDVYVNNAFKQVDINEYADVKYNYLNFRSNAYNCIGLMCHLLRKNNIDVPELDVRLGRFNNIARKLVGNGLFYAPQLIYSVKSNVNLTYLNTWFYTCNDVFTIANSEHAADVSIPALR